MSKWEIALSKAGDVYVAAPNLRIDISYDGALEHDEHMDKVAEIARMIAAAPEMLECLKVLIGACFSALSQSDLDAVREKTLAAIAKAEGRE